MDILIWSVTFGIAFGISFAVVRHFINKKRQLY